VDAEEDAEAEALLADLLKKHPGRKGADDLVKALAKRPYPSRVPNRLTFERRGPDGKTRQVTWIAPGKVSARRPAGILVFLHGAVRQPPPGGGANEAGMFAPAVEDLGLVVVGPSTYEGVEWGSPAGRDLVHHALRVVKQTFPIDENRVFVAGDSDGGRGTYAVVETLATFVAAAVPVIGSPGGVTRFANLRNVPFFAINGAKDTLFTIDGVRQAVDGMRASGIEVLFEEVADAGHDPRLFLTYREEVCTFLGKHPRVPFPAVVHWEVDPSRKDDHGGAFPADTFRWIRIDETGPTTSRGTFEDGAGSLLRGHPRVLARREGNRIEVDTRDVKRLTVLLAPGMVDVAKEVEVVANGRTAFRGLVEPDPRVVLEEARRFLDRALPFVARVTVDVDAPAAAE